jgi:hypothetical protein
MTHKIDKEKKNTGLLTDMHHFFSVGIKNGYEILFV